MSVVKLRTSRRGLQISQRHPNPDCLIVAPLLVLHVPRWYLLRLQTAITRSYLNVHFVFIVIITDFLGNNRIWWILKKGLEIFAHSLDPLRKKKKAKKYITKSPYTFLTNPTAKRRTLITPFRAMVIRYRRKDVDPLLESDRTTRKYYANSNSARPRMDGPARPCSSRIRESNDLN